jgi:glyoxylase-like metal-dependent hydrolase (beta-lactamase superfamily II)
MEILSGIHLADKGYSNVYLLVRKNKLILIDTGMDKSAKKIISYIQNLGYKPSDISHILLTHTHMDHIRGLRKIKELCNAKVAIYKTEADIVARKKPMIFPKGILGIFFRIMMPFMGYKAVNPDVVLKDGDMIEGLKVIHTPGHTLGSICFYDQRNKVLFSGDLLSIDKGKLTYPKSNFNTDEDMLKSSVKKISKMSFNYMLPGHGIVIRPKASEKLRQFLKRNP